MTVRRLLGLLTMVVMFHLTLVGPDNACTVHGRQGHSSHMMDMPGHDGMFSDAMVHGNSGEPCETPSSAHCCEAVTSCSVSAAIDAQRDPLPSVLLASTAPASTDAHLLSRALGPEPPPPKL
jgi:hypothetical protein